MTNKRFQEFLQKWFNEKISLNTKKSNDYAGEDETLKNFKQMSAILNDYEVRPPWTPAKWALVMCLMKIQRLLNIIQDCKVPKNEALDDTLQDQSLYTDLARACLIDEEVL